ncbi:MAG: topoisomerase C-terminal repeat-containing protein, partial [Pseudomonadota bacterium]
DKVNATIPKDQDPNTISFEDAVALIEAKSAGKKKKPAAKKAAAKPSASAKKATKKAPAAKSRKTKKAADEAPKDP